MASIRGFVRGSSTFVRNTAKVLKFFFGSTRRLLLTTIGLVIFASFCAHNGTPQDFNAALNSLIAVAIAICILLFIAGHLWKQTFGSAKKKKKRR